MQEKDFVDELTVYDVVSRADAAKKECRVIRIQWVLATKGSNDQPPIAREVGCTEVSRSRRRQTPGLL